MTTTHDTPVDMQPTTFSTDIAGLDESVAPASSISLPGTCSIFGSRPSSSRSARPGSDDRLQRVDPRPHPAGASGIGNHPSSPQRRRHRRDRALAWTAPRQQVRRRAVRDPAPIAIGGEFTYKVRFPDAGLYWYHPHIREDYGLDMGLYGNIVVEPADPDYWPPVEPRVRRHPRRRTRRRRPDRRPTTSTGPTLRRHGPLRQRHAHRR